MKIIVTGAAGFIGSHVCDALLARGDSVVAVDNFNDYYSPDVKESNVSGALHNPSYKLYRVDILDFGAMKDIFEKEQPDKVIHLAARPGVRPSIENPQLYARVNVEGTVNMLELARIFKVRNFVFASSSSVYGGNTKIPFSESDPVDNQVSPYAVTKRAGELLCSNYRNLYGLNISCLRFFTVYGPRGRPDMAPYKFTRLISSGKPINMFGDGTTRRDYTYIDDIVSGVVAALDLNHPFGIFNLGNSDTVCLKDFIAAVEDIVGKKAIINRMPMQPGDVPLTYADITKSRKMLGYDPKTRIREGLAKFYSWYCGNSL